MVTKAEKAALAELAEVDRSNRVGRTVVQVGASAAAFTLIEYVLAFFNADLDPIEKGTQTQIPNGVKEALIVLGAWGIARYMNRPVNDSEAVGGGAEAGQSSTLTTIVLAALVCLALLLLFDVIHIR